MSDGNIPNPTHPPENVYFFYPKKIPRSGVTPDTCCVQQKKKSPMSGEEETTTMAPKQRRQQRPLLLLLLLLSASSLHLATADVEEDVDIDGVQLVNDAV